MTLTIGSVVLKNPLIMAPMAGITDLPFRRICRQMGAALCHTEMVSAQGLVLRARNTFRLLATDDADRPVSVQLFGAEPKVMAEAAHICREEGADMVDINMGCPVPKVVKRSAGAALLKAPRLAGEILEAVRKVIRIPLTVKLRTGWTASEHTALDIALAAQDIGVDAVTLHSRARSQSYGTPADWTVIRKLKERLRIPVIGNGDILKPEDVAAVRESTGCDGVMIARGAWGNPWIFKQALDLLHEGSTGEPPDPTEILRLIRRHMEYLAEHYHPIKALHLSKSHVLRYTRGLTGGARFRGEATRSNDLDTLSDLTETYFDALENQGINQV